jgi:hypothetical protein
VNRGGSCVVFCNMSDEHPSSTEQRLEALRRDMHQRSRAVLTPAGRFGSLTLAAGHYGISLQAAYYRAKNRRLGWQYIEAVDTAQ